MEKGLISVDRFTESSQTYFLTHLHTDYTQGLTSKWGKGPLFCSNLTAKLLPFKFLDFNLSLLRVVDLHIWHSFSLISPTIGSQITAHVMALEAHHCPGKLIFLFYFLSRNPLVEFACLFNRNAWDILGIDFGKRNHYPGEITFWMVGYGDLMGLNCNRRGHVFDSRGVWMLDV